jgi:hypothetical protein
MDMLLSVHMSSDSRTNLNETGECVTDRIQLIESAICLARLSKAGRGFGDEADSR